MLASRSVSKYEMDLHEQEQELDQRRASVVESQLREKVKELGETLELEREQHRKDNEVLQQQLDDARVVSQRASVVEAQLRQQIQELADALELEREQHRLNVETLQEQFDEGLEIEREHSRLSALMQQEVLDGLALAVVDGKGADMSAFQQPALAEAGKGFSSATARSRSSSPSAIAARNTSMTAAFDSESAALRDWPAESLECKELSNAYENLRKQYSQSKVVSDEEVSKLSLRIQELERCSSRSLLRIHELEDECERQGSLQFAGVREKSSEITRLEEELKSTKQAMTQMIQEAAKEIMELQSEVDRLSRQMKAKRQ
eukprot:TRINITY_DN20242_c0_g2_i1.p1 TRINITY_DN20242_c0_g2~~TRINITY_DN20242_c0_g2_i1.p1  ORF type:complete len:319 (-),score=74.37 TRINITY_DN20242_c0_g2_i1:493-1449(-)